MPANRLHVPRVRRQSCPRRGVVALVIMLGCAAAASNVAAQAPVYAIPDTAVCAQCTIQRTRIATITDADYPAGAMVMMVDVHVASDGTFLVTAGPGIVNELFRADRSGRITARVGRTGRGPGEYVGPLYVGEAANAYHVFDVRLRRTTRLSKEGLGVLGTSPMPAQPSEPPILLPDGRYVINADLRLAPAQPLHLVSADGKVLRSFGNLDTGVAEEHAARVVAVSRDGALWVARNGEYRLEKWDTAGQLVVVYERNPVWFPRRDAAARREYRYPRNGEPRMMNIHEDGEGRLWIMIGIPKRLPGDSVRLGPFWDKSESKVIVEVLDPRRRSILASTTIEAYFSLPVGGGFFDGNSGASDLGVLFDVWSYQRRGSGLLPQRRRP